MVQGGRQGPWAGPVKAGDVHGKEVESCLRHQLAFKAARLAKKADRMSTLPQLLRKRKCGINVSGSAAGGDSDRELIGHNDPSWLNLNIRPPWLSRRPEPSYLFTRGPESRDRKRSEGSPLRFTRS